MFTMSWLVFYSCLGVLLIIFVPVLQVKVSDTDRLRCLEHRNQCRKTIAQVIGGLFLIFGLYLTYSANSLSESRLLMETMADSIRLLADDGEVTKLGGIYILEKMACDYPDQKRTVCEVLNKYVRANAKNHCNRAGEDIPYAPPPDDIQGIVQILTRSGSQDESDVRFRGASMPFIRRTNGNFRGADLARTLLYGATFSHSCFDHAMFFGADLRKAKFDNASLVEANLRCANLTAADLRNAAISGAFLRGATLTLANMKGLKGWHEITDMAGARIGGATMPDGFIEFALSMGAINETPFVLGRR